MDIERRIVAGAISDTEYTRKINKLYQQRFIQADTARLILTWVFRYFNEYNKAPGKEIQSLYYTQVDKGLLEDALAEDVEGILFGLDLETQDYDLLLNDTKEYFTARKLDLDIQEIQQALTTGHIQEAEKLITQYQSITLEEDSIIEPFKSIGVVKEAFEERQAPLFKYGGALGTFINDELLRGSFVSFMGPEKRGKTYMLMDMAFRAMMAGNNVLFVQAGDMTERQFVRRLGVYLCQRSDNERYCQELLVPVLDCKRNQLDTCFSEQRECDFGIFLDKDLSEGLPTFKEYKEAFEKYTDYSPCTSCKDCEHTVWYRKRERVQPITYKDAYRAFKRFTGKLKNTFKLITYPSDVVTTKDLKGHLDRLIKEEDYRPDVVVIDYADIMGADTDCTHKQERDKQNKTWQRLRSISQFYNCLVGTATQTDAASYDVDTLSKKNFSEDKRKYAHVTALWGLNQTEEEKLLGIIRINDIVKRDGEYDTRSTVKVLQRLQTGRPVLKSYF